MWLRSSTSFPDTMRSLVPVAPKAGKLRQKSDLLSKGALNLVSVLSTATPTRLMWVTSAGVDPEYVKRKNFVYRGIIEPFFLANICHVLC